MSTLQPHGLRHGKRHDSDGDDSIPELEAIGNLLSGPAEKVLIGQGDGVPPVWGDPIPKATDESDSFIWDTSEFSTNEIDISALFKTPLTGTKRRSYAVYIDVTEPAGDVAEWTKLTINIKVKIDGVNYRTVDQAEITKADLAKEPGIPIDIPLVVQDVQITFAFDVELTSDHTISYNVVTRILE